MEAAAPKHRSSRFHVFHINAGMGFLLFCECLHRFQLISAWAIAARDWYI